MEEDEGGGIRGGRPEGERGKRREEGYDGGMMAWGRERKRWGRGKVEEGRRWRRDQREGRWKKRADG